MNRSKLWTALIVVALCSATALVAAPEAPQSAEKAEMTEVALTEAAQTEAALPFDTLPAFERLRAPGGGDCGNAGDSCSSDSDCCKDLFCTDAANKNPYTCQAIAAAPGPDFPDYPDF